MTNKTGTATLSAILEYFGVETPLHFPMSIPYLGDNVSVTLHELKISGLNTNSVIDVFRPISRNILNTTAVIDNFKIFLDVGLSGVNPEVSSLLDDNEERIQLQMGSNGNTIRLETQVSLPEGVATGYTDKMCMNPECMKNLIVAKESGISYLILNTSLYQLELTQVNSKNEIFDANFTATFNTMAADLIANYSSDIPTILNGVLDGFLLDYVNPFLSEALSNDCQHLKNDPYNEVNVVATSSAFAAAFIFGLIFMGFATYAESLLEKTVGLDEKEEEEDYNDVPPVVCDEEENSGNEQPQPPADVQGSPSIDNLNYEEEKSDSYEEEEEDDDGWDRFVRKFFRRDSNASLLMTPKLPKSVRILMPFLVFFNMALFVSSNSGIGASVFFKFLVGEKLVALPSMFDFGLINSIVDMWKSKAYFLSILIAVMSCAWPYTKLIMMAIVWLLPVHILSRQRREKILVILDALGKWSLVDSYVMILMLIAFYVNIEFPRVSENVEAPLIINLFVYPAYGFIGLMLGTVVSLAISHIMLALCRHADTPKSEALAGDHHKISLLKFAPRWSQIPVFALLVVALALLVYGMYEKSFKFKFVGLAGWAFKLLGVQYEKEYSVFDLALQLPSAAEHPNSFGIRFTQLIYVLVSVLMPNIHIICLMLLWLLPLSRRAQRSFFHFIEVEYAWACQDVFIISIIAAIVEIGQMARFMAGDKCDLIDPLVPMFFSDIDMMKGEHANCFDVVTNFMNGSVYLIIAVVIHTLITLFINYWARKAIEGRAKAKAEDEVDDVIMLAHMSNGKSSKQDEIDDMKDEDEHSVVVDQGMQNDSDESLDQIVSENEQVIQEDNILGL